MENRGAFRLVLTSRGGTARVNGPGGLKNLRPGGEGGACGGLSPWRAGFFACLLFATGCGGEDSAVKKEAGATKQNQQKVDKAKRAAASRRAKEERQASTGGVSGSASGSSTCPPNCDPARQTTHSGSHPQNDFCSTVFYSEDAPFVGGFIEASAARIPPIGECLLQKGANVHARHKNGQNPLCHFVIDGNSAAVQWLLAKGADPNSVCDIQLNNRLVIHTAASKPSITVLTMVIDAGGNVNAAPRGWTPLHNAALSGNLENVKLLVSRGANLGVLNRGNKGQTALQIAEARGHNAVAAYLRSLRPPPGPH